MTLAWIRKTSYFFIFMNFFFKEIRDENGVVIQTTYNWITIGVTVGVTIITISIIFYLLLNSETIQTPDLSLIIQQRNEMNKLQVTHEVYKLIVNKWHLKVENLGEVFNMSNKDVANTLANIFKNQPEVWDSLLQSELTPTIIAFIQSL